MIKDVKKIIISAFVFALLVGSFVFAEANVIRDKRGVIIESTVRPTAAPKVDEDQISDAISYKGKNDKDRVSTGSVIVSKNLIAPAELDERMKTLPYTIIRHTPSIANVEDNEYEILHDQKTGRIKVMLRSNDNVGTYAKNGFYKINGKTFYFDENCLMVLGRAIDNMGCEYYFSEETGELIYEK